MHSQAGILTSHLESQHAIEHILRLHGEQSREPAGHPDDAVLRAEENACQLVHTVSADMHLEQANITPLDHRCNHDEKLL